MACCASDPFGATTVLRAEALGLGRTGRGEAVLEGVDLEIAAGECILLTGVTGAGKSTLLRAFAGLRGPVLLAGRIERSASVTLLLQDVETQLLCTTVGEEVALGPRARGVTATRIAERVRAALAAVGMAGREAYEIDTLSAGQKQRVVIASLLALEPRVLLLDEPSSALDPDARRDLARVLSALKQAGTALLIADHAPAELWGIVDRHVGLAGGSIVEGVLPDGSPDTGAAPSECAHGSEAPLPIAAPACEIGSPELSLGPGERVLLTGPNGAGKSTWLHTIARQQARVGGVALAIQQPRRSLFARTVACEIEFALRRHGVDARACRGRVDELLARLDLLPFADVSPLRLSFGQQHRLAMAAALAVRPPVVLLDEPFAGLDPAGRQALLHWLEDEQAASGATLVVASHDRAPLAAWCDRIVALPRRG